MNTTATCTSDHIWSRRCSTETVFSIQDQETDVVRDTSDTDGTDVSEYEPVTESEGEAPVEGDTTGQSDNEIISTRVIEVRVAENVDADSEKDDRSESDSELDLCDYWHCAQCRSANNNPRYRYCQKCFQVRKNFFPPRPKGRRKRAREASAEPPRALSQDSGVELGLSQGSNPLPPPCEPPNLKRRADPIHPPYTKRARSNSGSGSDDSVSPIVKTVSDPQITIDSNLGITRKVLANTLKGSLDCKDLCMVCYSEPKSGVFVHGRIAHICCCYKCAVKVWATAKRCPVCNCKVSNVLKAIVL